VPEDDLFQLMHLKIQTIIRLTERHVFYHKMYESLHTNVSVLSTPKWRW